MKGSSFLKDTYSSLDKGSKYVVVKIKKSSWKFWAVLAAVVVCLFVLMVVVTRTEALQEELPFVLTVAVTTQDLLFFVE